MKNLSKHIQESTDDTYLFEMSNIRGKHTGLGNITIWVSQSSNPKHGPRLKVSNMPNKADANDVFVITIPDLKIIGKVNHKFIKSKDLNKILEFVKLNMAEIIELYYDRLDLIDFLSNIKTV